MSKWAFRVGTQTFLMLTWVVCSASASDLVLIDVPGATTTNAQDINAQGDIVGFFRTSDGHSHGFIWSKGEFIYVDVPGATRTELYGVNDHGDIVGIYHSSDWPFPAPIVGFLLKQGAITTLVDPNGIGLFPWSINNKGDIVGIHVNTREGFLLDAHGTFTILESPLLLFGTFVTHINNAGEMVGGCCQSFGSLGRGFIIDKHDGTVSLVQIPGVVTVLPQGITARRQIAGSVQIESPSFRLVSRGFVLERGTVRFIAVPGASNTFVNGMNNRGDLIGVYDDGSEAHAFLLRKWGDVPHSALPRTE